MLVSLGACAFVMVPLGMRAGGDALSRTALAVLALGSRLERRLFPSPPPDGAS
jgi:hypothetical protein